MSSNESNKKTNKNLEKSLYQQNSCKNSIITPMRISKMSEEDAEIYYENRKKELMRELSKIKKSDSKQKGSNSTLTEIKNNNKEFIVFNSPIQKPPIPKKKSANIDLNKKLEKKSSNQIKEKNNSSTLKVSLKKLSICNSNCNSFSERNSNMLNDKNKILFSKTTSDFSNFSNISYQSNQTNQKNELLGQLGSLDLEILRLIKESTTNFKETNIKLNDEYAKNLEINKTNNKINDSNIKEQKIPDDNITNLKKNLDFSKEFKKNNFITFENNVQNYKEESVATSLNFNLQEKNLWKKKSCFALDSDKKKDSIPNIFNDLAIKSEKFMKNSKIEITPQNNSSSSYAQIYKESKLKRALDEMNSNKISINSNLKQFVKIKNNKNEFLAQNENILIKKKSSKAIINLKDFINSKNNNNVPELFPEKKEKFENNLKKTINYQDISQKSMSQPHLKTLENFNFNYSCQNENYRMFLKKKENEIEKENFELPEQNYKTFDQKYDNLIKKANFITQKIDWAKKENIILKETVNDFMNIK